MAGPPTLFQSGDHASRPAASAGCVLYWCTDHEIIYRSNGSAWSTWSDLSALGGAGVALVGDEVIRTAGSLTTSSTTFIDATGMSITLTTGAHRCLVGVVANGEHSVNGDNVILTLDLDGANLGGSDGLTNNREDANSHRGNLSFTFMTDPLAAGSHTFKLQWRVRAAGTGTLYASAAQPLQLWVAEQAF